MTAHDPRGYFVYADTPDPLPILTDGELAALIPADRHAHTCRVCSRPYDAPVDAIAARAIGDYCSLTCMLDTEPALRDADLLPLPALIDFPDLARPIGGAA